MKKHPRHDGVSMKTPASRGEGLPRPVTTPGTAALLRAALIPTAAVLCAAAVCAPLALLSCDIVPTEDPTHYNDNDPDNPDYAGPDLPEAVLSGTPGTETYATSISVTVGGAGVVSYKYSLDGAAYSEETDIAAPITAVDLEIGAHTLSVLGKNADELWQWESRVTTYTWTILEQTDFTPPDMIDMNAFAVSYLVASAPGASLTVSWEQPAEYVLVVRSLTDINDDLPANGTAYAAGEEIAGCEVVYAGDAAEIEETEFTSDGTWNYRAFAYDEFYNYAGSDNQVSILVYKDAMYVHYNGSDSAGNGTSQAPLRTIQAGITKAVDTASLHEVRVAGAEDYLPNGYGSSDTLNHVVTMTSGVSIRGGYSPTDWSETARDPDTWVSWIGYSAEFTLGAGNCITVDAENITAAVTIDGFTIDGVIADGNVGQLITVFVDTCSAPVEIRDCVITGGEIDTDGATYAIYLNNCEGTVTIAECSITGGLNAAGEGTYGILITDAPAVIENNQRIWGGTSAGGPAYGISASGSAAELTISGNDNGIDCIANASGQSGACYGIYLEYCGETMITDSNIMACAAGTTAENPYTLSINYTDVTIRNSRLESRASVLATTSRCISLNGSSTQTVTAYNNHILATGATGGTSTADVHGIYAVNYGFSLYNNNIGAGPAGSTGGTACALYMTGYDAPATAVANNNIYCVSGGAYDYGIFEAGDGQIDYFRTNNFINCADALYYDDNLNQYIITLPDLNNLGPGNINENGVMFNSDGSVSDGESLIDTEGTDGEAAGWGFGTDKDGVDRTPGSDTDWSIGPYEYD